MYRCVIMDADAKRHGHGNCNLLDVLVVVVVESREISSRIGTHSIVVVVTLLLLRFIDLCCVLVMIYYFCIPPVSVDTVAMFFLCNPTVKEATSTLLRYHLLFVAIRTFLLVVCFVEFLP